MPVQMPHLHVDRNVTISIKTKDWDSSAHPMVGFALQIGQNVYVVGTAPANADGQTVSVTLKIPQIHNAGPGPFPCALRIAYCDGVQADGFFTPKESIMLPQPIATGQVFIA